MSPSENAMYGSGFYYALEPQTASRYAAERGEGSSIEFGHVDLSKKKLLNLSEIDRGTPEFKRLVKSLGLTEDAGYRQIYNMVKAKFPDTQNTMFPGRRLGEVARSAGYEGIIGDVGESGNIPAHAQVMLFDKPVLSREIDPAKAQSKAQKDYEKRLTAAEKKNLAEVEAGNKAWLDSIRDLERREAAAVAQFEAAQKKDAVTAQAASDTLAKIKTELELERSRVNQQLKEQIAQRGQMDADAIANALKESQGKLDFADLATKALLVPRESLPIAIVSRPLVVTRVYNSTGAPAKRVVTQPTDVVPQTGAGPTAGAGEVAAGQALGSDAFKTGVRTIDRYLRSPTEAIEAINKTVDSVWKTELGNQLVQVYNGLDAKGKPSYRYHLYGVNGTELYSTTKLEDIYRAMAINEHRLRNTQSTVQKPNIKDLARGELERMLGDKQTYFQSQGYVGGRAEEQERERKRQETLAGKYSR